MAELPFMMTENILMDSVKAGGDRQEVHERIRVLSQEAARNVKELGLENNLLELIANDTTFNLTLEQLKSTMDPSKYIGRSIEQVDEYLSEYIYPIIEENKDLLCDSAVINI
jgi:adenylosuccinate lyase